MLRHGCPEQVRGETEQKAFKPTMESPERPKIPNAWWRGGVIYQIYPRSFQDSDGDGVGDLKGIVSRLAYIASLGVDGIWLSPVFASPMCDFGYDISDYCAIDPVFGTLDDFDALIARAHALGLKVIIDQVYSHTSDQHPWFQDSRQGRDRPKADWYVWADAKPDGAPPNNWQAVFGGPSWTWESQRRQYYLHNFLRQQPDLNLHHPDVQTAILKVARFWLDRGVDGFRLDVANCYAHDPALTDNPPSAAGGAVKPHDMQRHVHDRDHPQALAFAERLRAVLDEAPGRMSVAELFSHDPFGAMAAYTAPGRYHTGYCFHFLGPQFGADFLRDGLQRLPTAGPDAWPSFAFSNHDVKRVVSRWGLERPQPQFAKLLFALLTSLRGTAFMYQGEELGLPQSKVPFERLRDPDGIAFWPADVGRDGCRTPMPWVADAPHGGFSDGEPWLPFEAAHASLAVDRQIDDPASMLNFVRRWLDWRRAQPALRTGEIDVIPTPPNVLGFMRRDGVEAALLLFNLGAQAARVALPCGAWREAFDLGGKLDGDAVVLPVATAFVATGRSGPP
jgi:alpha-glucosidase